jgi:hypothetical protein
LTVAPVSIIAGFGPLDALFPLKLGPVSVIVYSTCNGNKTSIILSFQIVI